MPRHHDKTFAKNEVTSWSLPNYWDGIALILVIGLLVLIGFAAHDMTVSYQLGEPTPISLDPSYLPYYALRSVLRMLIALGCSVIFTFIFGTWAAKSTRAERIIIPLIDVLQSVPVLGFLSIAIVPFLALFPGSLLGPEAAAIFAIFTSQVWNMVFSFYQSCRSVPYELREATAMLQLTPWQNFWRLEVPFAMPGLIWNAMMSMSASWFFVVAAEAITTVDYKITLPGIGSYIGMALPQSDLHAVFYAILAMFFVILAYDQLLFRPLNSWIDRFKSEENLDDEENQAWITSLFQHTKIFRRSKDIIEWLWESFIQLPIFTRRTHLETLGKRSFWQQFLLISLGVFFAVLLISTFIMVSWFLFQNIELKEVGHVTFLGMVTGLRVMVLIFLSSLIWVPVGVWIGLRPRLTRYIQPIIQFLAAFPAYLLFPLVVIIIVNYNLNPDIWTSPLIVLGTQWYILFNIIVGTMALPKNLKQVTQNFQVKGWLWWKRFILPGIFPYYITGAITAAGGAWNASIVAETVNWGGTKIHATGLGAYISQFYELRDFPRLTLGIAVMCLYVVLINRIIWQPLYNMTQKRFLLDK